MDILQGLKQVHGIYAAMVMVDPATAAKWLERNTHNRKCRPTVVEKYVSELLHDEWRPVPAGIGFDEDGVLIDGQHRLTAIVRAKVAAPLLVVYGFARASQEKCDRHLKRTTLDVLRLAGMSVCKEHLSAAVFLTAYAKGPACSRAPVADCDLKQTLSKYSESLTAMAITSQSSNGSVASLFRRAGSLAAFTLWHFHEPQQAKAFRRMVLDGTAPSATHPASTLARSFTGPSWDGGKCKGFGSTRQKNDFGRCMYAIAAARERRDISLVRMYSGPALWEV